MAEPKHPWVEDYTDFEAVLVCRNTLPEFMVDADLRAFQTFGWDDATTPGNDRTFTHAATGVIIRYEGPLVAIEYADDRLTDALDDLFRAVYGLGWRLADVYHPIETMDRLLSDMGRKIPGSLSDFDLRAAKDIGAVSDSAEGAALVAQGRKLMGGGDVDQFHEGVLREFSELDHEEEPPAHQAPAVMPNTGPLFVEGLHTDTDQDFELGDGGATSTTRRLPDVGGPTSYAHFDDEEMPRVFHPPGSPEALAQERAQRHAVAGDTARRELVLQPRPTAQAQKPASLRAEISTPAPSEAMEQHETAAALVAAEVQALVPAPVEIARSATPLALAAPAVEATNIVKVGISAFCFSRPGAELDPAEVEALAEKFGAADIVHLRPGVADAKIHWDVLGEFTAEQPHLAEKVAAVLSDMKKGNALLAASMLELRETNAKASLRDVLDRGFLTSKGGWAEELQKGCSPVTHTGCEQVLGEVIGAYAGLFLCKEGTAFFDTDKAEEIEVFTVREVMQSSKASIFVVHEDSLDGPSVGNVIAALERLARSYESSKRHVDVVATNREVSAGAQKKAQIMHAASEKLAATFRELQDMGLTLPMVT